MNQFKFLTTILSAAALLFLAAGCLSPGSGRDADLNGTTWQLESFAGNQLLESTAFTAEFEDTQIRGDAGCNQYFGTYQVEGNQVTITDLGWTEMACLDPEGLMEQEQQILNLLGEVQSFQRENGTLQMTTAGGQELIFTKTAQP